jgi:hypothetical protein
VTNRTGLLHVVVLDVKPKILIPSAFIYCRAVHLRAAVITRRYMHVLRGQMPNWWCKWGGPLDPACIGDAQLAFPCMRQAMAVGSQS